MPLDVCMQAQSQLENHYSTYEQIFLPSSLCVKSAANNKTDKPCVRVCACVRGSMHGDPQEVSQQMFYLQN